MNTQLEARSARLPVDLGDRVVEFDFSYYDLGGKRWISCKLGDFDDKSVPVLLRIESACVFGHIFGSVRCDCGFQLAESLRKIGARGRGIVLYSVDDDARGLGIKAHFDIYHYRQKENLDTEEIFQRLGAEYDNRNYEPVIHILRLLEVESVELLSNNLEREKILMEANIRVVRHNLEAKVTEENMATMMLEKEDLGHDFNFPTHGSFLAPLVNGSQGDARNQGATLVDGSFSPVLEVNTRNYDLAEIVARRFEELYPAGLRQDHQFILYLSDFPRPRDFELYSRLNLRFLVLPFSEFPGWLKKAAAGAGIRLQDWERYNGYAGSRDQWEIGGSSLSFSAAGEYLLKANDLYWFPSSAEDLHQFDPRLKNLKMEPGEGGKWIRFEDARDKLTS